MSNDFLERFDVFWSERQPPRRRRMPDHPKVSGILPLGDTADANERLLGLILDRRCTALISSLYRWQQTGREIPAAGEFWLCTDSGGRPRCILRTEPTQLIPYRSMTEELIRREGRESSLRAWQERWRPVLFSEARERNRVFSLDQLMVVMCFQLVYFERDEGEG